MPNFEIKETPVPLRTQRAVSGSLILFILSALLLLGVQGITLFDRVARSNETGLDNHVWVFAQLEVEAKNFSLAMLEGIASKPDENPDPAQEKLIRSTFDIYYSRIRTVASVAKDAFPDADMQEKFEELKKTSQVLANSLDDMERLTQPNLQALYTAFKADMPFIRKVANSAMLDSILEAEKARETRHWIVSRLQLMLGVVILLMIASVSQAMKVSRSVGHHAAETAMVAARLRRTVNASLDAVVIVDSAGNVVEHNAALRNILKLGPNENIIGTGAFSFIAKKDRKAIAKLVADLRENAPLGVSEIGTAQRTNTNIVNSEGKLCPVELSCAIDQPTDGLFTLIAFIRDRSQEVAAADVLRDARDRAQLDAKAKERFLSVLSHEMRTPLNGVITSLELIQLGEVKASDQGFLLTASACAKSALTQIDDVLALTRNGYLGDPDEPFCPATLIDEIVTEIVPLALERGNRVAFDVAGDATGAMILAKSRSFKLTVRNLIANAVKYTSNGKIDVLLDARANEAGAIVVQVSVKDTGVGIGPEDQTRIFDEFAMVSDQGADDRTGFGLGLAIAKSSVERLQGTIDLESELGKGSRFFFTFEAPLAVIASATVQDERPSFAEPVSTGRSLKVLIVDDNPVNRALLSEMVRRLGHNPDMAQDGTIAIRLACEKNYDLILMDLSMPGLNGFDTALKIRTESVNTLTKIFALTARDLTECAAELPEYGFDGAFQKPIGMVQLRDLIDSTAYADIPGFAASNFPILNSFQDVLGLMGMEMTRNLLGGMVNDTHTALKALVGRNPDRTSDPEVAEIAHRAGGSAAVLGATRLAELWRKIEVCVKAQDEPALESLARAVPKVFKETMMALDMHRIPDLDALRETLQLTASAG